MKTVTSEDCQAVIENVVRLKLAGVAVETNIALGPPVILRRVFRNGRIKWEILNHSIANLILLGISENEPEVARARIFRTPPKEAPKKIVADWMCRSSLRRRRLGKDSLSFPSD